MKRRSGSFRNYKLHVTLAFVSHTVFVRRLARYSLAVCMQPHYLLYRTTMTVTLEM